MKKIISLDKSDYFTAELRSGAKIQDAIKTAWALCKLFRIAGVLFVHNNRPIAVDHTGMIEGLDDDL